MKTKTEHWGRIFIWAEHIAMQLHPDDLERALELSGVTAESPSMEGKVLGDIAKRVADGVYVTVELSSHTGTELRIKKAAFKELPESPQHVVGDTVRVSSKGVTVE